MFRKQGRSWHDYLQRVSDPLSNLSIIPYFDGFDAAETFANVYRNNSWDDAESRSGPGSRLDQTEEVRNALPDLLTRYQVRDFIDVPCGDWNWMNTIDLGSIRYRGGDIVPELIETNKRRFGNDNRVFEVIDLIEGPLPSGDLLLCRDCLVHFSFKNVERFLANLHRSGIRYLLTTTFTDQAVNHDIATGDWRPINLEAAPFNFSRPLELIAEDPTGIKIKFSDKCLGLWKVSRLPKPLI